MNTNYNQKRPRERYPLSATRYPLPAIRYQLSVTRYPRRGVTLLLVLGLMTMFALLVVAFMTVTTQSRRAAETAARIPVLETNLLSGASQRMDTDLAIEALLVGNKELNTPIAIWSILENMYGHPVVGAADYLDGIFGDGTVSTVSEVTTGVYTGFWAFSNSSLSFAAMGPPASMDPAPMELAGSVLTIKALGPNAPQELLNKSTRIYLNDNGVIYFVPFEGFSGVNPNSLLNDCTYIINGAPFSGTGPGFDPTNSPLLTGEDGDSTSFASRPNILAPSDSPTYKEYLQGSSPFPVPVLMNPDYTAPDHLNMFLAWFDLTMVANPAPPPAQHTQIQKITPSFHRPRLVDGLTDWNQLRKRVLRPLSYDHPNFNGSNPTLEASSTSFTDFMDFLANGPWDVDNDNDGIPDSIWVDAGLGTYVDPKTNKMYKKMVCYLVRDMDGRLNINVHGNDVHTNSGFNLGFSTNPGDLSVRGSGYGPAEVMLDLGLNFVNSGVNPDNILKGTSTVPGRHGNATQPNSPTDLYGDHGIREEAYGGPNVNFYGGLPYDFAGTAAVSFDLLGNRIVNTSAIPGGGYPYAFNVYAPDGNDNPFLAEQFAAIFQTKGDVDFGFQQTRLRELLNESASPPQTSLFRHHLTPMSSDVPSPSRFMGVWNNGGTPEVDWSIYRKVWRIANDHSQDPVDLLYLLPEEIRQGLRVNLNRPTLSQNWVNQYDPVIQATQYLAAHKQGLLERAKFAQEIFYLLLVLNYDELYPSTGTPYTEGTLDTRDKVLTRLAQWSVNLVDFMDPDATMTPFTFSTDPLADLYDNEDDIDDIVNNNNSWTPSGNIRLIWGMEKPEVAITETLATHDRRVADGDQEGGFAQNGQYNCPCGVSLHRCSPTIPPCPGRNQGGNDNPNWRHDTYFDQIDRPQGSLFIELYRCGNSNRSQISPELAAAAGSNNLDLAKRSRDASGTPGNGDYIWRLAIGEKSRALETASDIQARQTADAQDLFNDTEKRSFQPTQWPGDKGDPELIGDTTTQIETERYVWFGSEPTAAAFPNLSEAVGRSYWKIGGTGGVLAPDSYLVIGPRSSTTLHDNYDSAPSVELNLPGDYMIASTSDNEEGVNVSEPMGGYGAVTYPADKPLDGDELFSRGTIPCYRSIFLQRLADPNRPHNAVTNPYITVDWNMIDLHVFNSERESDILPSNEPNPDNPDETMNDMGRYVEKFLFASRQWGVNGGNFPNIQANPWDRNTDFAGNDNAADLQRMIPDDDDGDISLTDNHSFGQPNKFWTAELDAPTDDNPFVHFAWNDSPFANTLEVMQVPASSASRFGIEFHDRGSIVAGGALSLGTGQRFRSEGTNPTLGYLLNFEAPGLNLVRFLEQVHVPSRFAGTIVDWTSNGEPVYSYREPGKINLNTVTESAWTGLQGNRPGTNWTLYSDLEGLIDTQPFRSSSSVLLTPMTPNDPIDATLLRPDTPGGSGKLFKPMETTPSNMYNEYENAARLSGMTTNRSNVFAVWVTVGYFEAEWVGVSDIYPDGYRLGKERGLDGTSANVKRHRAFYLIDRTIPVGFRRGEVLNSKDVIIYNKVLE